MNLLGTISEQIAQNDLPLVAITLAAVPCPDTPLILTLHWHGFVEEKIANLPEAATVAYTSVPSSALQVNQRWQDLSVVDQAAMEAGWELGAWDVARAERFGCRRAGAEARESFECLQAFGAFPFGLHGKQVTVADAPDCDELLDLASRRGYLMWMFRPVHRGIWADVSDDKTLKADGTREPPCPVSPIRPTGQGPSKTIYRFGLSGNSSYSQ